MKSFYLTVYIKFLGYVKKENAFSQKNKKTFILKCSHHKSNVRIFCVALRDIEVFQVGTYTKIHINGYRFLFAKYFMNQINSCACA